MTQTVEIPASRWLNIKVPKEVSTGAVILTFTPVTKAAIVDDCPLCAKYRDPKSGALQPNAETIAAIEETNKPSAKRFNSLEELLVDLRDK